MNLARLGHPLAQRGQEIKPKSAQNQVKRALISYDKIEDVSTIRSIRCYANAKVHFSSTNPQEAAFNDDHAEKTRKFPSFPISAVSDPPGF